MTINRKETAEYIRTRLAAANRPRGQMADKVRGKGHAERIDEAMLRLLSERRLLVMRRPTFAG